MVLLINCMQEDESNIGSGFFCDYSERINTEKKDRTSHVSEFSKLLRNVT